MIFSGIGINVDVHTLPGMHFSQLRFFKISGDPDIFGLRNDKQLFARFDALPDFDRFVADDTISGRIDFCVREIERGLVRLGLRREESRAPRFYAGLPDIDIARRIPLCFVEPCLRL